MSDYGVLMRRFGALGIIEHESAITDIDADELHELLRMHLATLGPGDTLELTVQA